MNLTAHRFPSWTCALSCLLLASPLVHGQVMTLQNAPAAQSSGTGDMTGDMTGDTAGGIVAVARFMGKELAPLPGEDVNEYCGLGRFFMGDSILHYTSGVMLEGGNLVMTTGHTFLKPAMSAGEPIAELGQYEFRLGSHFRPEYSSHELAFVDYPLGFDEEASAPRDVALACLVQAVEPRACPGFSLPTEEVLVDFHAAEHADILHVAFTRMAGFGGVEPGSVQMFDRCFTSTVPSDRFPDFYPNDCTAEDGHSGGIMGYNHPGADIAYAMGVVTGAVYNRFRSATRGVPRDAYNPDRHFTRAILVDDELLAGIRETQQRCDALPR